VKGHRLVSRVCLIGCLSATRNRAAFLAAALSVADPSDEREKQDACIYAEAGHSHGGSEGWMGADLTLGGLGGLADVIRVESLLRTFLLLSIEGWMSPEHERRKRVGCVFMFREGCGWLDIEFSMPTTVVRQVPLSS
jgi:hypothetical protein